MTNKIVILQNSVELYEHYINDEKWERTLSFPKGGLTYLISNGTIKFYAYEDYFYRNCLMSMQLPVYIVDEINGIDGEYSDVTEITEILDEIFPINDIDAELLDYLTKREAELTYQPIGDYALKSDIPVVDDFVTDEELVEALDDYYTKDEADARFQPIGDYLTKESGDTLYQPIGDYLTSADTYSKQEIDGKLDDKLDASAYTPCDLSNYYTKQETSGKTQIQEALDLKADADSTYTKDESNNRFQVKLIAGRNITISGNVISAAGGSGGTVDAYTKEEADARFQPIGNYITDTTLANILNDYSTKEWITNQHFVTESTFNTYITNLQEQINSLQEALETCCSYHPTGETIYRWITLAGDNDFICSGTTKYEKQQKQQSTDNGITWVNVSPAEYQRGNVIEYSSTDCGAEPQITDRRWVEIPNQYMCKDTPSQYCKYHVWKLQYSYDSGTTWVDSNPLQTTNGGLINCNNVDCGYIEPQYRWTVEPNEYLCSGTSKYEKEYYEVSYDSGSTWERVEPEETRRGDLIETLSTDCGYVAGTKFSATYSDGTSYSAECDSDTSLGGSVTRAHSTSFTAMTTASVGSCIKTIAQNAFSGCSSLSSVTLTSNTDGIANHAFDYCTKLKSINANNIVYIDYSAFRHCEALTDITLSKVRYIDDNAFEHCTSITSITVGSSCVSIGNHAFFACYNLTRLRINATTPPTLSGNSDILSYSDNAIIYVPSGSVNAYKTAWSLYADRIRAI